MNQMAFMAEVERAKIVILFNHRGDGIVQGVTYSAIKGLKNKTLAKALRAYADLVEDMEDTDD